MEALKTFIQQYVSLIPKEWEIISSKFQSKAYKKGELLLEEGKICSHISFLENGLLRFFIWKNGEPVTKFFTIAPYMFTSQRSFNQQQPAKESIEALEDSIVWQLSFANQKELLKLEVWQVFARKITQEVQFFTENILEELQNETAEKRYLKLLDTQPELLQRVPLKHLASFFGVAPQSLSRIRKKVVKK